ncbi:MAG: hypothetical protein GY778_00935, partial [bacterium]|nr:hypothetical protein [bacterium]
RLAPTIEAAWRGGARFDGWDESFDAGIWRRAFDATGIDPAFYAQRERSRTELLPWSHLGSGPAGDYLERQYTDIFTQLGIPLTEALAG